MHLAKTSDIVVPLDQIRKTFDEDYIEDLAAPRHTCNIGGKCSVPPATALVGYAHDARPSPPRAGPTASNAPRAAPRCPYTAIGAPRVQWTPVPAAAHGTQIFMPHDRV